MAAELVRRRVNVIVANTPAAPAAKAATATIPIVFLTGEDPVANGLVASFNRPGGNVTGVGVTGFVVLGKQLGVLHQLVPTKTSVAFLVNPNNPNSEPTVKAAQEAARALGRQIRMLNASTEAGIPREMLPPLIDWQRKRDYPLRFACEATLNRPDEETDGFAFVPPYMSIPRRHVFSRRPLADATIESRAAQSAFSRNHARERPRPQVR